MTNLYNKTYAENVDGKKRYAKLRNTLRISTFTKLVKPNKTDIVLEVGSNTGQLLRHWQNFGVNCRGIDINSSVADKDISITEMDVLDMHLSPELFDKVVAFEVFEHIYDLSRVFANITTILKQNGTLHITVPFEFFRGQTALFDAWHAGGGLSLARKLHVHRLTPYKIKKFIKGIPLEIKKIKTVFIPWPSFYIEFEKITTSSAPADFMQNFK